MVAPISLCKFPNNKLVVCKLPKPVILLVSPYPYASVVNGIGIGAPANLMIGPPKENEAACCFFANGFTNREGAQF
jgi:hypothetical protein